MSMRFLILLFFPVIVFAQPVDSWNNLTSSRTINFRLAPVDTSGVRNDLEQQASFTPLQQTIVVTFPASPTAYSLVGFRSTVNLVTVLGVVPGQPMIFTIPRTAFQVPAGLTLTATYSAPLTGDGSLIPTLGPDTVPPTAPVLTATASSGNTVGLTWSPATDNIGVVSYTIERCVGCTGFTGFVQLTVTGGQVFGDSGLTPGTSYSYRVNALDAAGNIGPYSNIANITTPLPPPPPPPAPTQSADCTKLPPTQQLLVGKDVWTPKPPDPDATPGQIALYQNGVKRKGSITYATVKSGVVYNYDPAPPTGSGAGVERWNGTGWTFLGAAQSLIPCP